MLSRFILVMLLVLTGFRVCAGNQFPATQPDSTLQSKSKDYSPDLAVTNIFREVVANRKPPRLLDTLETRVENGDILVRKIHFESVIDQERINRIFSYVIYPNNKPNLPAVLILHGGTQTADDYYKLGLTFASRGYAVLIPDLPGITSPERAAKNGQGSSGKWAEHPYGQNHFLTSPSVKSSNIYEGVVTAIQAFYLLKSQPFVNVNAMGIRGLSWGGYASVITTALLGKQVKAGFAVYGSGFYDLPSYFKTILDKMDDSSRKAWLASLDAGRYARRIKAPFYFMAASNDTYFHPPAVLATYHQLKRKKFVLFSPNNDHDLSNTPDPEATELAFFDQYLRHQGAILPQLVLTSVNIRKDNSQLIEFKVKLASPVKEIWVWYAPSEEDWMKRTWTSVLPTVLAGNRYQAILPALANGSIQNWYVTVTDEQNRSTGTVVY